MLSCSCKARIGQLLLKCKVIKPPIGQIEDNMRKVIQRRLRGLHLTLDEMKITLKVNKSCGACDSLHKSVREQMFILHVNLF